MRLLLNLSVKEKVSKKISKSLLYFIAFMYAVSTGEVAPIDLFNTVRDPTYGYYARLMNEAYTLGINWKYGMANACEIISKKIKKRDILGSQLMMKLAQVLRLGESLSLFLKHEFAVTLKLYSAEYGKELESIKMLLSIFSAISSTGVFMISSSILMAMLSGGDASMVLILVSSTILMGLGVFVYLLYTIFPRDELLNEEGGITKRYNKLFYLCIITSALLGIMLYMSNILEPLLAVAASSPPLIFLGFYARKIESRVLSMNNWYPIFIRQFGEIYATIGSIGATLRSVLKNDFGPLSRYLHSMLNRIENRVDVTTAFKLFSMESGNAIITNCNAIVSASIIKGANMNIVGNMISEITLTFNELYSKRVQIAKVFESTLLIMHILSLAVLSFMSTLAILFSNMLSNNISNVIEFGKIDPNTIDMILPFIVICASIINGFAIKVANGGLYKTVWFNIGLFMLVGSLAVYAADLFMNTLLKSMIELDLGL